MKKNGYITADDVVVVVRCKNCRFWQNVGKTGGYCSILRGVTGADAFCSSGVYLR